MPSLTTVATAAAQFLQALDSGETLSTQQLNDALAVANNLLLSWFQEQNLAMQELISIQSRSLQVLIDQLAAAGFPQAIAYTLAAGTYAVATYTAPTWTPGTAPAFADLTTPISFPSGYIRALELGLAIELAPQYDMMPNQALLKQYAEARAAVNPTPGKLPVPGMSALSEAPAPPG